tara:strand:+ start:187 stop:462 length:276 start_codon:yes stop_codon:yes gene_type:complete
MGLFKICTEPLEFEDYIIDEVGADSADYAQAVIDCLDGITDPSGICDDIPAWQDTYENEYIPNLPCKPNYLGIGLVLALGVGVISLIRRRK